MVKRSAKVYRDLACMINGHIWAQGSDGNRNLHYCERGDVEAVECKSDPNRGKGCRRCRLMMKQRYG